MPQNHFIADLFLNSPRRIVHRDHAKSAKLPVPSEHEEQGALIASVDLMANRF
jgi:hypothetical protein